MNSVSTATPFPWKWGTHFGAWNLEVLLQRHPHTSPACFGVAWATCVTKVALPFPASLFRLPLSVHLVAAGHVLFLALCSGGRRDQP